MMVCFWYYYHGSILDINCTWERDMSWTFHSISDLGKPESEEGHPGFNPPKWSVRRHTAFECTRKMWGFMAVLHHNPTQNPPLHAQNQDQSWTLPKTKKKHGTSRTFMKSLWPGLHKSPLNHWKKWWRPKIPWVLCSKKTIDGIFHSCKMEPWSIHWNHENPYSNGISYHHEKSSNIPMVKSHSNGSNG